MKLWSCGNGKVLATLAVGILANCAAFAAPEPPPVRLAYNYCTLSYTFAYYTDEDWDAEIGRLAEAGYNVALVLDGTFKVWQATLRELGYDEESIAAFIPDECARAWWLMDNLSGEGGPLDQATIDADGARGRRICAKMREKGIEPILQGFFGMMPKGDLSQGKWGLYERPPMVDPTGPAFAKLAEVWYRNLEAVYGIRPKYLAGDLFHEGGRSKGVDVTAAARAVQGAQQAAFPGVTWVVQAWQRNPTPALRAGLDPRFTLIEALVYDMSSLAKDDAACDLEYGDIPWVWCEVLNFGGNHGLYGNLKTFAHMGRAAKGKGAKTFRGYGSLSGFRGDRPHEFFSCDFPVIFLFRKYDMLLTVAQTKGVNRWKRKNGSEAKLRRRARRLPTCNRSKRRSARASSPFAACKSCWTATWRRCMASRSSN